MIFLAAFLLDPFSAFIAGGVGTFLYDVILGNAAMMFPSLIIHGLQAVVVSVLLHCVFPKKRKALWAGVSSVFGALIVIGGYFVLRYYINGYALAAAGYKAVANVIQEVVGISIALSIYCAARFKKGGSV